MRSLLLLSLLIAPLVAPALAQEAVERPRAGLMWNHSGLPAVFPLQVKTPAGQDFFLRLINANTAEIALAAYIRGGEFFKVLVPPGDYFLRFAYGQDWQGEQALFGDATQLFPMKAPLSFGVGGISRKKGYTVRLIMSAQGKIREAGLRDQSICQQQRWAGILKERPSSEIYSQMTPRTPERLAPSLMHAEIGQPQLRYVDLQRDSWSYYCD